MKADFAQYEFWHPKLRELAQWLEGATGIEFTLTSEYRIGDPSVHGQLPLRGIDIRCRHKGIGLVVENLILPEEAEKIQRKLKLQFRNSKN